MRTVYIVSAARTAVGRGIKGTLKDTRPEDMAGTAIKGAVDRAGIPPMEIDDVIMGCAMPEGTQGMNIARIGMFVAGLPYQVPAMTVNRFCSSGLQAISIGANAILAGMNDVVVAGGVESMSTVPMGGYNLLPHPGLMETYPEAFSPMGITAELVVNQFNVTREEQDKFAYESHMKAVAAIKAGRFADEIVPLEYVKNWATKEKALFTVDEGPRPDTTLEGLGKLKGAFVQGGTVTAGNSSQVSDGAAAVVLASEEAVKRFNLKPLARFVNFQVAGVPPEIMGIGPAEAIPKLFKKTGIKDSDVSVYEINEAFASQSVYCVRKLEIDPAKVNVNGGAIALGHPLGATGAKLTVQILNEMKRRNAKYGVVSMCIGGGMGGAGLFELA